MTKIDLTIPDDIVAFFEKTIALLPEHEFILSATKGALGDGKEDIWLFDIMPMDAVEALRKEFLHDCMVDANGCSIFVYPYDLVWELDGKIFYWGDEHIELAEKDKLEDQ